MGALLVPNKPIYRENAEDEYYIYFSKETVEKASQMYLTKGNQNNTTLEHHHKLTGLTLVESWLVEDEVHDKARKYGMRRACRYLDGCCKGQLMTKCGMTT
jgi:hypothetical protein